jgi:hypothetical protein
VSAHVRETIMNVSLHGRDALRIKRLRRSLKEGMKTSRLYHDNPADTGSLYRKRWITVLEVYADIIKNSSDKKLVEFAKDMFADYEKQLPKTFADWLSSQEASARASIL